MDLKSVLKTMLDFRKKASRFSCGQGRHCWIEQRKKFKPILSKETNEPIGNITKYGKVCGICGLTETVVKKWWYQ